MSYNKKVWKSGDRITKEALNNMENGIETAHQNSGGTGSVAIVDNLNSNSSTSALSAKQGKELNNKMPAKSIVEGGKIYLAKEDGTKIDSGTELPAGGSTIEVVNNLESDSTTAALSAAQGKALNTQYKEIVNLNNNSPMPKTLTKLKTHQDTLIMFTGDSITEANQNTNTMETSYVACICKYLKELYPNSKIIRVDGKRTHGGNKPLETFDEVIVNTPTSPLNTITVVKSGVGGDTLLRLQKRMNDYTQYKGKSPDVIFMMEGINDSLTDDQTKYIPVDLYEKYYRTLIQYLKRETTSEIILMTSHWHGDTPSNQYPTGKTYNLNHYIEIQKKVALLEDLYIIDHKKIWDKHFVMTPYKNWGQGDWLTKDDATHPTPIGQEYGIAKTIWNEIFVNNQLLENQKDYYNYRVIKYDNPVLKWVGTWNLQTTTSTDGNMTFKQKLSSSGEGDSVKFTLKAKEINLLTKIGKSMGSADIYVNGTKVRSINNNTDYPIQDGTSNTSILGAFYVRENIINSNNDKDYEVEIKVTNGYFIVYGVEYKTDYEYPVQFSGVVSLVGNGKDNYKSITISVNNGVGDYILIPSVSNLKYKTSVIKNSSGSSFTIFVRKYDETTINTDETCDVFWIAIPN